MRVVAEEVDYRVGLYHTNGSLIKLLNPVKFACVSSPCTYSVSIGETERDYVSYLNVDTELTFNSTSNIWTLTWSDPEMKTNNMSLTVTKLSGSSPYVICSVNGTGNVGAIKCNTTGYTGTLRAVAYRTASPSSYINEKIVDIVNKAWKGVTGLFISVIIIIVAVFIGVISPIGSLIMLLLGIVPAYLFGSINLTVFGGIGVMIGIIIHFITRTEK